MHYLIALICLVLSLAGVEGYGSQSHATRATVNGVDVIYSRIRIVADIADITCVRSASGQCHYRLLTCPRPAARGASASACDPDSVRQFVLASGASRDVAGLPGRFMLCVGDSGDAVGAQCDTLAAARSPLVGW
jgi:hypothetical protein